VPLHGQPDRLLDSFGIVATLPGKNGGNVVKDRQLCRNAAFAIIQVPPMSGFPGLAKSGIPVLRRF